ncbi:MAG: four helix bundle protein [Bacteroidia bacterium]
MRFTDNPKYKENTILKLSFELAVDIIKFSELLDEQRKFTISKQILRSGTSIGANIKEAQNAESKADFIHKLKISSKEADELEYWLLLCNEVDTYPNTDELLEKLTSVKKLLNKIISSTKKMSNSN